MVQDFRQGGNGVRARVIHGLSRVFVRPTLTFWPLRGPLAPLLRPVMHVLDLMFRFVPRLPGTRTRKVADSGWCGELVEPVDGPTAAGAIVYLHGGAFVFCGLATHRRIVERLALRTGLPVLSVDYRQHPRGRLDDSMEDVAAAVRWLHAEGIGVDSTVFIGDSAGGFLAFALALEAPKRGIARPIGVIGLSAWLDLAHEVKLAHRNARSDVFLPAGRFAQIALLMAGDAQGVIDPLRSPVNGELAQLPPALLICAEDEVLRADAEVMSERLLAAGVEHRLQVWQGQVHAFPVLGNLLPESRAAIEEIAEFIRTLERPSRATG
ncbi:alpha/beta hydrolase [Nocardia uniformis]|uniref:Alpha/beta hydrolase n=2 Tax=Nocardia uniformis TaxID=53432 RepID=A0A849BVM8_9NOCA|nr:alpha/beta hydrolase [Nocardia uniformis]NNH70612.1 alpha/beta hydrolase [Nocardia uniformis]